MATKLNTRDAKTMKRLTELADNVVEQAGRKRDPYVDVPTRALSNVRYNKTRRFIEMGGTPGGNTPAEFAAFVDRERESWKKIVDAANLTME